MPSIKIEITEKELKELIYEKFFNMLGDVQFKKEDIQFLVKSKQNYKSEWEIVNFRASIKFEY